MGKRIAVFIVMLFLFLTFTVCKPREQIKIEVSFTYWSWLTAPDFEAPTETYQFEAKEGETIEIRTAGLEITIKSISANKVKIVTNCLLVSDDYYNPTTEFTITIDEPLELTTLMTDAGINITFKILE